MVCGDSVLKRITSTPETDGICHVWVKSTEASFTSRVSVPIAPVIDTSDLSNTRLSPPLPATKMSEPRPPSKVITPPVLTLLMLVMAWLLAKLVAYLPSAVKAIPPTVILAAAAVVPSDTMTTADPEVKLVPWATSAMNRTPPTNKVVRPDWPKITSSPEPPRTASRFDRVSMPP